MGRRVQEYEPSRLLDVGMVAKLLGVSTRQVYRLADGGKMPQPIKLGGSVRWDRAAIAMWIEQGCPVETNKKGAKS